MPDLKSLYSLATADSEHRGTVGGAVFKAAFDITNEGAEAPNHANRLAWAQAALSNLMATQEQIFPHVLANPGVLDDFTTNTGNKDQAGIDSDVQYTVNTLISDPEMLARFGYGG